MVARTGPWTCSLYRGCLRPRTRDDGEPLNICIFRDERSLYGQVNRIIQTAKCVLTLVDAVQIRDHVCMPRGAYPVSGSAPLSTPHRTDSQVSVYPPVYPSALCSR